MVLVDVLEGEVAVEAAAAGSVRDGSGAAEVGRGRRRWAGEAGMTTAEYAVGTVAACGVGGVLVKVLTSETFAGMLWKAIEKAFSVIF